MSETNPETEVEEVEATEVEDVEVEEVTAEEVEEVEPEEDSESEESEEEQSEDGEPEEEDEEVEIDGEKYRVPKALKDKFLMHSDYTRKTQEVAEQRKELDAEKERVQQTMQSQQQNLNDYAQLSAIDQQASSIHSELQQLSQVDLSAMDRDDPERAQMIRNRRNDLQYAANQLASQRQFTVSSLQQREQQTLEQQQQELAKRIEEGRQTLAKEIKDWSPELGRQLAEFGKANGFSEQEMQTVTDPRTVKLLHKAYLYDQAQRKAKNVSKPKPQPAKPIRKVGGKASTGVSNPDKLSIEQWMKWDEQRSRKRY